MISPQIFDLNQFWPRKWTPLVILMAETCLDEFIRVVKKKFPPDPNIQVQVLHGWASYRYRIMVLFLAVLVASQVAPSRATASQPTYAFPTWSKFVNQSFCSNNSVPIQIKIMSKAGHVGIVKCAMKAHPLMANISVREYQFPAGIFEIDSQFLIPERTSIVGDSSPNDVTNATRSPNWNTQTLFLATRGVSDYLKAYCHASNMVTTRVGFVLSSYVSVTNLSYQVWLCDRQYCHATHDSPFYFFLPIAACLILSLFWKMYYKQYYTRIHWRGLTLSAPTTTVAFVVEALLRPKDVPRTIAHPQKSITLVRMASARGM